MEIDVVILAAGLSRRMGTSKVLLPWRGGTLLEAACQVYGGLGGKRIVVIGGERAEEAARIVNACGFTAVYNEKPERGKAVHWLWESPPWLILQGLCFAPWRINR